MKVLASDFDNTLFFYNDKEKTNTNLEAINKFVNSGNIFCLITGRSYMEIKKELDKISIPYSYLICGDGAQIFNNKNELLNKIVLDEDIVLKVIDILKRNNYVIKLENGFNFTTDTSDCIKVAAPYNNRDDALKIVKEITDTVDVYCYASRAHINVNNKECDKGKSLFRLCKIANISNDSLYVIGDDINDYEMLKTFNGAIVSNHTEYLNKLDIPKYESLSEYINELLK